MNTSFDVIVIGVGSMGSSACYYLSKKGYKVLGVEQFGITHEQGAHAGQSRIIRKAYFEHPDYVPLLQKAYENWKSIEVETGEQVYFRTGLVYFGKPGHEMIKGVRESADLYDIQLEKPDRFVAENRYPQFRIPGSFETLYEPYAGFLTPEKAIRLYTRQAEKNGVIIHTKEKVIEWKKEEGNITVITDKNNYQCNKLVITAGAWAGKMIPGFTDKIRVTRQFVAWVKPKKENDFTLGNFPCWMMADDERPGCYYGFPVLPTEKFGEPAGLKVAHHYAVDITDPDKVNRQASEADIENLEYCLEKYMPGTFDSLLSYKICLYANSPDENFIIDKLPGNEEQVVIACGFSGHGFKFVSLVGEVLADLATEGKTKQPIGFLNVKRFA